MALPQRRLPVGAEILSSGEAHFRVWAPRRRARRGRPRRRRPHALCPRKARRLLLGHGAGGACGRAATGIGSTAARAFPIPPRASSPRGRTARRRSSIPRFPWRDGAWKGVRRPRAGHLRDARRHVHAARARGRAAARELPRARRPRRHRARGDAGRRLPRPLRLGLRRRRPVRADAALRHARRLPPLRRSRARARPRRDPRRRLQPLRPGRQLPARSSRRRLLHRPLHRRVGRGDQLRRRRTAARCASSSLANAALLDRRVSPRRPAPRRHAEHLRRLARRTSWPRSRRAARAAARGRARSSSSPRTSRRTRGWCGRSSEGGYGLDALWNDDFHHARDGRADRPQRGLLHRLPRHAAGVRLGR